MKGSIAAALAAAALQRTQQWREALCSADVCSFIQPQGPVGIHRSRCTRVHTPTYSLLRFCILTGVFGGTADANGGGGVIATKAPQKPA